MSATDTIVALSTPPGRSGIGVVRLSGRKALELTRSLLNNPEYNPEPNRASLKIIPDRESGEILDRAVLTYFKFPQSYTGEDVVEISCHGSPPLLLRIIDTFLLLGARAAEPGEFTMRALSNGRLNLTQAEAVRDLIDAQTQTAVRQAARQLSGELSARLQPIKDSLLEIIVPLESSLEFVEDDLPHDISAGLTQKLSALSDKLEELADTFNQGRLLKDGLRVALVGRPNVGKSSLFNKLVSYERAIVTDIPGTTRDTLSEVINFNGVPILITDTAGVRASTDKIEQLGIERTRRAVTDSDLTVVVLDGSQPVNSEDEKIFSESSGGKIVIAVNKSDLGNFRLEDATSLADGIPVISISAKTGKGIDDLRAAIMGPFSTNQVYENSFVITSARHYDLLRRTSASLRVAEGLFLDRISEEFILVKLYDALRFLGEVTGETTPEDILSEIFSSFCIGK